MAGAVLLCGVGSTYETGDRPRPTPLLNLLLIRLLHGRCLDYSVLGEIMPYMATGRRVITCRETCRHL